MSERPILLLVEDDAALVDSLSFAFELEGFQVKACFLPETLLAMSLPFDGACLVIDLNLPGMDGIALLDTLRARGVTLPAILITTHPTAQTRSDAAARGVPIVEKPLLTDALLQTVRDRLAA